MSHLPVILIPLAVLILFGGRPATQQPLYASLSQAGIPRAEVRVWVNTRTGVYWCPGTRYYGKTKWGQYMGECAARKAGYRPAYRRPCGSRCP